mgnify:CR=1 FL=1
MKKEFIYIINNQEYKVFVITKRMRYIRYRFRDGAFLVSCPYFVTQKEIKKGLDKFALSLIEKDKKDHLNPPMGEDYIYILGEKYHISPSGSLSFNNGLTIKYKSIDDLYKKLKPYLLDIVVKRVRYYEAKMGISKPYNVKVRDMSSRYGSNVKSSYTVTFALLLVHYSINIIESVIVHELAHDKVYNHSAKFYDVVYKYCPDYDKLHNHLRKKIYHD